ncbi:MAG: hypothetical protein OXC07_12800 [Kistimonas sp.]|nr:hypothetical protein [Kistimonas sp.]
MRMFIAFSLATPGRSGKGSVCLCRLFMDSKVSGIVQSNGADEVHFTRARLASAA